MGLLSKRRRPRISYLLVAFLFLILSPQVTAATFNLNCDPSDIFCRHQKDPERDDVEGVDNVFNRPSFSPTTISVPPTVLQVLKSPAPSATSAPTRTPAPTASQLPTFTIAPTTSPTTPAPTDTHAPTSSPPPTMTSAPTPSSETSAPTVTPVPTSSPAPTRTTAPSLPLCDLDDSGFYGDDDNQASPPVEMELNYQIQLRQGTSSSTLQDVILPLVENAIVIDLLPSIFPCSGPGSQRLRILQNSLSGISAKPSDLILSGVACSGIPTNCFVVDAKLTLYGQDAAAFVEPTKNLVEDSMDEGKFDEGVDSRIVAVRFLNETSINRLVGESNPPNQVGGTTKEVPIWGVVLIVIVGVIFLALCCACPLPCGKGDDDSTLRSAEKSQQQTPLVAENLNQDDALMPIPESSLSSEAGLSSDDNNSISRDTFV